MKKPISRLLLSGLLLLAAAFPSLASNHKKMDAPNGQARSGKDAGCGLERAAERRAEQAGDHGMDAMEKQRQHMEQKDAMENKKTREKMQQMDKIKHEGKEKMEDADKMRDEGKEMMKDADKMEREGREMMREGDAGMMDQGAEQAEKAPKKRRWYWPFGDAE